MEIDPLKRKRSLLEQLVIPLALLVQQKTVFTSIQFSLVLILLSSMKYLLDQNMVECHSFQNYCFSHYDDVVSTDELPHHVLTWLKLFDDFDYANLDLNTGMKVLNVYFQLHMCLLLQKRSKAIIQIINSVNSIKSFSLEKQRFRGNLVNVYKYLNRDGFFSTVASAMTRGSGYKLECRKVFLNTRKQFSGWWTTGTGCPEAVRSPPWSSPKAPGCSAGPPALTVHAGHLNYFVIL